VVAFRELGSQPDLNNGINISGGDGNEPSRQAWLLQRRRGRRRLPTTPAADGC
jgi:hypothetical protein